MCIRCKALLFLLLRPKSATAPTCSVADKRADKTTCSATSPRTRYFLDAEGKRVYTLNKADPSGAPTISAHPARFSPDDKYSRHRVTLKKRFGVLLTDSPAVPL